MKFINLREINSDIITPGTLWLTCAVYQPPLRSLITNKILAYARKVQIDFMKMLGFMLRLNGNIDFEKVTNIEPCIAYKN